MNYFKKGKGFTLIEVVIALAIFGMLIGGLLGFLPWGVEGVGKVKDRSTAHGMVDAIQLELERLGFSLVEAGTKRLVDSIMLRTNRKIFWVLFTSWL